jgi:hypothetical protein
MPGASDTQPPGRRKGALSRRRLYCIFSLDRDESNIFAIFAFFRDSPREPDWLAGRDFFAVLGKTPVTVAPEIVEGRLVTP